MLPASSNGSATAADSAPGSKLPEPSPYIDLQRGPLSGDSTANPMASTIPAPILMDPARSIIMNSVDRLYVTQFLNRLSPQQLLIVSSLLKVQYGDLKDRGFAQGSVSGPDYTNRVMRSGFSAGLAPVYSDAALLTAMQALMEINQPFFLKIPRSCLLSPSFHIIFIP